MKSKTSDDTAGGVVLQRMVRPLLRRPGAGWKRAGLPDVPVWDHVSGIRVHTSGLVTINGVVYSAFQTPEYYAYWKAIARQGMSRRRGAMVWALEKARSMANAEPSGSPQKSHPTQTTP